MSCSPLDATGDFPTCSAATRPERGSRVTARGLAGDRENVARLKTTFSRMLPKRHRDE
jgi:hypothetical protein